VPGRGQVVGENRRSEERQRHGRIVR
jgi:hypothetical protein